MTNLVTRILISKEAMLTPNLRRMYMLAKDFFPENKRLNLKIEKLREKLHQTKLEKTQHESVVEALGSGPTSNKVLVYSDCGTHDRRLLAQKPLQSNIRAKMKASGVQGRPVDAQLFTERSMLDTVTENSKIEEVHSDYETEVHQVDNRYESDGGFHYKAKAKKEGTRSNSIHDRMHTPRTKRLLDIVNARDTSQIRLLRGVGAKKAEVIVEALGGADGDESIKVVVSSVGELGRLKGVGPKTVESMRMGLHTT